MNNVKKERTQAKYRISLNKKILIIVLVVLLVAVSIVVYIYVSKNSMNMVTDKLTDSLGKSISYVEKSTHLTALKSSKYELVNSLQQDYSYILQPTLTTSICGKTFPTWSAYISMNSSKMITKYTIYDFRILSRNILGSKTGGKIDTSNLIGYSEDTLLEYLNIKPYIRQMVADGTKTLVFRYYYHDESTDDNVCIQVIAKLDGTNRVQDINEVEVNMLYSIVNTIGTE